MALQFEDASREGVPQKIGIMGPAGSGKTLSALKLACGMASSSSKVFVIDTENKRAKSYDWVALEYDKVRFKHLGLTGPYPPELYLEAFDAAVSAGAEVVVIDSLSHVWEAEGGILNKKELMDAKNSTNTFANWAAAKRPLGKLIRAVLNSPVDVIITIRSKIDYQQKFDETKKRNVVETLGLQPVMQPGFEYELMTLLYVADSHIPEVRKDLTATLYDIMEPIDYKHGEAIRAWKEGGEPPAQNTEESIDTTAYEDADSEAQEPQPEPKPSKVANTPPPAKTAPEMAKPADCERLAQAYFELEYQVDWDTETGLTVEDWQARKAAIIDEYKEHLARKKKEMEEAAAAAAIAQTADPI